MSPSELIHQEEAILRRLEQRDDVQQITDIARLHALWQDTAITRSARAAIAERLVELGTVAAYSIEEAQRREVYALIAAMVEDPEWAALRAATAGAVFDPAVLRRLLSDRSERVARSARKRLEWLNAGLNCRVEQGNGMTTATVVVGIDTGFCGTAAMFIAKEVARYRRRVTIERPGDQDHPVANAVSVLELVMLNAEQGVRLRIQVEGDDDRARGLVLNLCGILESPDVKHLWLDRHLVEEYR